MFLDKDCYSGMIHPGFEPSTNILPPTFISLTPCTALRKKKFPSSGKHRSFPKTFASLSSSLNVSFNLPFWTKVSLAILELRSPIRKISSIEPTRISTSSGASSLRKVSALPHSEHRPRLHLIEEENSLNGAAAMRESDAEEYRQTS